MLSKSEIKQIASLGQKKNRTATGWFVAEGEKLCKDLMRSGLRVHAAFSVHADPDFVLVPIETMQKISRAASTPSHLAVFYIPKQPDISAIPLQSELVLALDEVQDPGNMGTIIRTACWFGISHIVCSPGCADCYNPKVVQSSMGAVSHVNIYYTDLAKFLHEIQGTPRYGTFLEGQCLFEMKLTETGIIVLGNEGNGISAAVEKCIDTKLFIPSYSKNNSGSAFQGVESLNVAGATAIICSEFKRDCINERLRGIHNSTSQRL